MNLANLMENGIPLLGRMVDGGTAFLMVLALGFIGPAMFLFALWTRKTWGPMWAYTYIGLFVFNGIVALLTVIATLGLMQILVPNIASMAFAAVIYWQRDYFAPV